MITFGFPRMKKEAGERRVFLPEFIQFLAQGGARVFIEEGYGSRSGFTCEDFRGDSMNIHSCSREEALQKDYVMILRSPKLDELEQLRQGSCLISMLHFPTRPKRIARLKELGIKAISLDGIVNDHGMRLVEDMKAVAWNGLEVAFDELEKRLPRLDRGDGRPVVVVIVGTGMVGKHAVDAATKLGNIERNNDHIRAGGVGSIAIAVGRNVSTRIEVMESLLKRADILVDATQRRNCSCPVIPNAWIAWLPEHAVLADLSVDPYTLDSTPVVVRGIEGVPQGNLNQYVFEPHDPKWDETVPASIPSDHRRTAVTCYSWPGIHPEASMRHYGGQLIPLIQVLLEEGYDGLSLHGEYFERALYRGTLKHCIGEAQPDLDLDAGVPQVEYR
jgi:alanine dehydrogenase